MNTSMYLMYTLMHTSNTYFIPDNSYRGSAIHHKYKCVMQVQYIAISMNMYFITSTADEEITNASGTLFYAHRNVSFAYISYLRSSIVTQGLVNSAKKLMKQFISFFHPDSDICVPTFQTVLVYYIGPLFFLYRINSLVEAE